MMLANTDAVEDKIDQLHRAMCLRYGTNVVHAESALVKEELNGITVWEGTVEVFDLHDHPIANRVYAWHYQAYDGRQRCMSVLHVPPATSPKKAVHSMLFELPRKSSVPSVKVKGPATPDGV